MKHLLLFALGIGLSASFPVIAQRTILNPRSGYKENSSNLKITRVELRDSATVLYFRTAATPRSWIRIPANTYIQPAGDTVKYFVQRTEGIPFNQPYTMPDSGLACYAVYFPPINKNTALIDYGENASNGWKIYDIQLAALPPGPVPGFLNTEWYEGNSGEIGYAFYDRAAITGSTIYSYSNWRKKDKNSYAVTLQHEKQPVALSISRLSDSAIRITKNGRSTVYFSNRKSCTIQHDDTPFTTPVLKSGKALFSGYIKDYNVRHSPKNMMLFVDDILAGTQENVLVEIAPDGHFSSEIPLYNPGEIFITYGNSPDQVYLAPGGQLFAIRGGEEEQFMGSLAGVNEDLQKLRYLHLFDYNRVSQSPVMSPDSFKHYVFDCGERERRIIDSLYARKEIGKKAWQIKQTAIRYNYLSLAMEYHYIYHDAPPYPAGYLNFITSAIANDPLALTTTEYWIFINRIKFNELLRPRVNYMYNYREMIDALKRSGTPLSDNDQKLYAHLAPDGASVLSDSADTSANTLGQQFYSEHQAFVQNFVQKHYQEFYDHLYDSVLHLSGHCQAMEIMRSQDLLAPIKEQLTPKDDSTLQMETAAFSDTFIRDYIVAQNQATRRQIAANRHASGYTVNETPRTAADKVFDSIMAKYRGKLVYVDFWATWCGPCRNGIKEIGPLKEELRDKNIAFVYITNETSPEETYKNMIPTIKGEHYRLKQDEYNYLAGKFQISGIPHYVLVDKAGQVINPNLGFNSNEDLKALFSKYL